MMSMIIKRLLKGFLFVALGLLLLLLSMNVLVPVYVFDEPEPFHGDYLHNPYQEIDSTGWKICNFHGHTRQYGGVTNGRVNANVVYDSMYRLFNYDHVGISDYNKINNYESINEGHIPAYEHGYNIWKIHQLCIGAEKVRRIDYFFFQTLSMKQHMLNKLLEQNRVVAIAHPSFVKGGYLVEDMKYLSNYRIMESINGFVNSPEHWDSALSNGHRIYLIADDDTHNVLVVNDIALRITCLNAENTADGLCDALLSGKSVGVDFHLDRSEKMEDKVKRFKRDMPFLNSALLENSVFSVNVTKPIKKVEFIGQGGKVLSEMSNTDRDVFDASYCIQPSDTYVRTVITFFDGTSMYLNPVTRHEDEKMEDQSLAHISYFRTAVVWSLYLASVAFIIYLVFIRRKKKKTGT
ncbi:MAG: hypothetical protein ACI358_01955 [Candidatus Limimorpha sp.]